MHEFMCQVGVASKVFSLEHTLSLCDTVLNGAPGVFKYLTFTLQHAHAYGTSICIKPVQVC